ncbi:dihydrolipoyl dehydrogenase [Virgibacillus sp. 179-BFC.A HS]|uniref:Dihydrolipoyl dehydrogenase n=1 Tax=Tigheibacillus jepli TaxID=3035914 RepID=A0ABU5CII2_9BACI|nr:dihydrolipoyl dehydrogenase [Virgibacillus sp. 179-BFC.A HS]MDY0405629.1 dihydrolipoyl dehydrogenase [Virgibacillus sp. 179-BFC.A HS]
MATEYDLAVLGGGTGGYVAAIRASQLGMRVAVIEKSKLGGTCLHKGCIPSKALLQSAQVYRQTKQAATFGVNTNDVTLDYERILARKDNIVQTLHRGVQGLMKKGKIDVYAGHGRILGPSIFSPVAGTVSIEHDNDEENTMIVPKNVLIATGSVPNSLPNLAIDGEFVLSSDDALRMQKLPESMIIVGGGVIGIEWASMLCDFGVKVTVMEYLDTILPTEDASVSKEMEKQLTKRGVQFIKGAKVLAESLEIENGVTISAEVSGNVEQFSAEKLLVSVGRKANTNNIGLENTDIELDHGYIQTNDYYQTKESHIYAIGDCIGNMQLAHVASHEAITAVEHMADLHPDPLDYEKIPACIYSFPEAASVGLTEKQATDKGYDIKIGRFGFQAIGKALVAGETEGFVKIIADKKNDDILGVHMIGPHVTDMISEAALAKVLDATPWEVSQTIHPHPSLSEIMGEAALAVDGLQIHG